MLVALALAGSLVGPAAAASAAGRSGQKAAPVMVRPTRPYHALLTQAVLPQVSYGHKVKGCAVEPKASCPNAKLSGTKLRGALLAYADLTGADLADTDLLGATLTGATTTGATYCDTIMPDGSVSNPRRTCS